MSESESAKYHKHLHKGITWSASVNGRNQNKKIDKEAINLIGIEHFC